MDAQLGNALRYVFVSTHLSAISLQDLIVVGTWMSKHF